MSLMRYQDTKEFSDTVTRAKARIEQQRIEKPLVGLHDSKMAQFDLKNNFKYKDKVETEITGSAGGALEVKVVQFSRKKNEDANDCNQESQDSPGTADE
jgi:hypothetical protein